MANLLPLLRYHCSVFLYIMLREGARKLHFFIKFLKWPETSVYTNFGSLNRSMVSDLTYEEAVRQNRDFSS